MINKAKDCKVSVKPSKKIVKKKKVLNSKKSWLQNYIFDFWRKLNVKAYLLKSWTNYLLILHDWYQHKRKIYWTTHWILKDAIYDFIETVEWLYDWAEKGYYFFKYGARGTKRMRRSKKYDVDTFRFIANYNLRYVLTWTVMTFFSSLGFILFVFSVIIVVKTGIV